MLTRARLGWVVLTLIVAIVPLAARAGMGHRRAGYCGRCARAFVDCGCAQPFCSQCQMAPASCSCQTPVMQMQIVPQTTTVYRQEQFTTMQPVTRTEIRRQTQIVDVPVTTCRQVTVDEGAYQTVWVPKLTTKTVAETSIQKQVRYQDVPYQVVQQVPVVQTRIVPRQVTAFVPRTTMTAGCNHGHSAPVISSQPIGPGRSLSLVPTPESYSHLTHDHQPGQVSSQSSSVAMATNSMLAAASNSGMPAESGTWSKVQPRQTSTPTVQPQNDQAEIIRPVSIHQGHFNSPALPSAATVWRAQDSFRRN